MKRLILYTLLFFASMFALSFTTPDQRRELVWNRVMADGTPNKYAGWDANGDPVELNGGASGIGAANEIQKTDGSGTLDNTGLFSTVDGNLTMGDASSISATRTISVAGSLANIDLDLSSKGTGEINLTSGTSTAVLSNSDFRITTSSQVFGIGGNVYNSNRTSAATNSVETGFQLNHLTSGVPAAGIGVGLDFGVESLSGTIVEAAYIQAVSTDVSSGSEDFDLVFNTMSAGAQPNEKLRIRSDGTLSLGSSSLAGSRTLAVESSTASRLLSITFPGATTGGIQVNTANAYQQWVNSGTNTGISLVASNQSIVGLTNNAFTVKGYSAGSGIAGDLEVEGGDAGSGTGGDLILSPGTGTTANGNVIILNIPTSSAGLPSGAIWSNAGVLTIVP